MKILLVSPEFPRTYWGFQYTLPLTGKRSTLPPLGLLSLAALLPREWQMRLVDMNIERLEDRDLRWADAVLVGGMHIQMPSMREILARARALGRPSIVGGPGPTTSPEEVPSADHVFLGEAEGRVDSLVRAIEHPGTQPRIVDSDDSKPDMKLAPVPRFDLLDMRGYVSMSVQTSRGCPYTCEFCDIIEIYGRFPRVKAPEQVVGELQSLFDRGWRGSVFVVDDNFIGNRPAAMRILPLVREWQKARRFPFPLYTEASVNLASKPELVTSMVEAGFTSVFLGIETPSREALRGAGKHQNLRTDLGTAVESLTRAGLEVMGGFIVGFDSDGPDVFERQREFISSVPLPLAMVGMLQALPGTALWRRLQREGRLREQWSGEQFDRPNFEPAMDEQVLLEGYFKLMSELYDPAAYYSRAAAQVEMAGPPRVPHRPTWDDVRTLLRALIGLGIVGRNRRAFWKLLARTLRRAPGALPAAIAHAVRGEHLVQYTMRDVLPRLARAIQELRQARVSGIEAITNSAHGEQVPRQRGIVLELGAKLSHEVVDGTLGTMVGLSPDRIEDLPAGKHTAVSPREQREHLELGGGQIDRLARPGHPTAARVHSDGTEAPGRLRLPLAAP